MIATCSSWWLLHCGWAGVAVIGGGVAVFEALRRVTRR